jgi:hypothetical protein
MTKITDAGLKKIARLKTLTKLNLDSTALSESAVAELKAALPGCHIWFSRSACR